MSGDVHVRNFPGVRFPPGDSPWASIVFPYLPGDVATGCRCPGKCCAHSDFLSSARNLASLPVNRPTFEQDGQLVRWAIRGVSVELSAVSRPCRLRTPPPRFVINPSATCPNGRPPAMRSTANGCRRQGRQRGRAVAPPVPFSAGFLSGSVSLHGLCPIDRDGGTRCGDRRGCRELRRGRLLERGGRHLGGTSSRERDGWWNLRGCSRSRGWERRGGGGGFPDGRHRLSRLGRRGLRGRRGPIRQDPGGWERPVSGRGIRPAARGRSTG